MQAKNQSGVSGEDVEKETMAMFFDLNGKSFRFLECVPILKQIPKYCFENGESVDVDKVS